MHRRLLFAALIVSLVGWSPPLAARAANPFADLGLPEIAVTVTERAIDGGPSALDAGRYLLSVTNETAMESATVSLMQVPAGMTTDEVLGILAEFATPTEAMLAPPSWYYETRLAGGVAAAAGETAYGVIDLPAGDWLLWSGDPAAPQPPVPIAVTGDLPTELPEPDAAATITAREMTFAVDGALVAGPQVVKLTNAGEQPHFLYLDAVPAGTTPDDFLALMASFMDPAAAATPTALTEADFSYVANTGDLSGGATMWLNLELSAGDYQLVCFFPDLETGLPHAMLGMIEIITVE